MYMRFEDLTGALPEGARNVFYERTIAFSLIPTLKKKAASLLNGPFRLPWIEKAPHLYPLLRSWEVYTDHNKIVEQACQVREWFIVSTLRKLISDPSLVFIWRIKVLYHSPFSDVNPFLARFCSVGRAWQGDPSSAKAVQNVRGIFGIRWSYVVEYAINRSVVNTASGVNQAL